MRIIAHSKGFSIMYLCAPSSANYRLMKTNDISLQEQREWVKSVLKHTGLKPSQLASKIKRSASTLVKPLNEPENTTMLSGAVLADIADYANLRVMEFPGRQKGFTENEAVPFYFSDSQSKQTPLDRAVEQLIDQQNGRDPWVTQSSLLNLIGILPGDILIVDLNQRPRAQDIVCAQIYDFTADRAETAFRVFDPPYLVARSTNAQPKPMVVDDDSVKIMGVVLSTLRPKISA